MPYDLIVVLGPTASGKTKVGVEIARALDGEIISADSRQVYRGMDIGTGKDLAEYGSIPYHLIDIVDPGNEFNIFEFQCRFFEAFKGIRERHRLPVLVGGTGMYLDAVIRAYRLVEVPQNAKLRQELASHSLEELAARLRGANPKLHNTTDLLYRERLIRAIEINEFSGGEGAPTSFPAVRPAVFGIQWERKALRQRITRRLKERLDKGMIDEVRVLLRQGVAYETLEFYGLEYRFVAQYLKGEMNRNDMFQKLNSAIHQFAKRQETWFHRMERHGVVIHWVAGDRNPAGAILQKWKELGSP